MEEKVPKLSLGKPTFSRLSSVNENIPSVSDNEDSVFETERSVTKKFSRKQSRSHVLLGALKKELKEVEAKPALRRHRKSKKSTNSPSDVQKSNLERFNDTVSTVSWPRGSGRRRFSSLGALTSRSRRRSSVSSGSSGEYVLTDLEMRKINMLQTLQNMGVKIPKRSTLNMSPTLNEVDVIENMQLRRKRSLTTRMLEATKLIETKRATHQSNQMMDNIIREVTEVGDMPALSSDEKKKAVSRQSSASSDGHDRSISRANFQPKHRASIACTSIALDGIGAFRKRIRRRKVRPVQKFKRLAKFLVVLLRAWRVHAQSVHEILMSFDNLDAVAKSKSDNVELLFDITDYRVTKEAKISDEFKRILRKKPKERTPEEIYYIQIALRNYQSIVEYPVHMQKMIAERGWYESYSAKRIIVREGHIPMCFYFILTGSGIVSALDRKTNQGKTLLYLSRGDSFGEQAIMTRSRRRTTVISRDRIELLVISDSDFVDIFMSGGLRNTNDPFLRSIDILKEWPVEILADNPKKAIFSYFKRNTVLVADSLHNDWIFIVKSGSCNILKKLDPVAPKKTIRKKNTQLTWREQVVKAMDQDKNLSHSDQLALLCEEEIKRLEEKNSNIHFYALPEINVATNAAYAQLRKEHEKVMYEFVNQNSVTRAINDLKNLNIEDDKITDMTGAKKDLQQPPQRRRMSVTDLGNLMLKTPYMAKIQGQSVSSAQYEDSLVNPVTETEQETELEDDESEWNEERVSTASTRQEFNDDKEKEKPPVFINVRTLTKGEVFGLQDIVFENQTTFSLVSNGVEVIMINKKFYTEQLTISQVVRLRSKVSPYPSEENLKDELTQQVNWDYHKKVNFLNALRNAAIRKQNMHDARSHLTIPPVAV